MASKEVTVGTPEGDKPAGTVNVDVREAGSSEHVNEKHDPETCEHVQWETGFWKRFPWIGALALFTMLLGILASGLILWSSNLKYREEWPVHEKWTRGKLSEQWRRKSQIEPHVLLAIVNTVTNLALAIAIGHGVAIAWWRRVLKGSTIEDLHRSWGFASSILELLTAGRKFNYIALAALMAKLALIDNVLLQQAVSTGTGYYEQKNMEVSLPIVPVLPPSYAGVISADDLTMAVSSAFSWDEYEYLGDAVIDPSLIYSVLGDSYDTGCVGMCDAEFDGFGFEWDCSPMENSTRYTVNPEAAKQNSQAIINKALDDAFAANNDTLTDADYDRLFGTDLQNNPVLGVIARFIPFNTTPGEADFYYEIPDAVINKTLDVASIGLQLRWSNYTSTPENDTASSVCSAITHQQFCFLKPATVRYSLEITNITTGVDGEDDLRLPSADNGITLIDSIQVEPQILTLDNITEGFGYHGEKPQGGQFQGYTVDGAAFRPYEGDKHDNNLKHIAAWLQSSFGSGMLMEYINKTGFQGYAPNVNAMERVIDGVNPSFASVWVQYDPSPSCSMEVFTPLAEIGHSLNRLMVRSSLRGATELLQKSDNWTAPIMSTVQKRQITQNIPSLYYITHWSWGIAAMCTIFVCFLCVLPSYWGFWQLGRKVTLGPIEVAGAFQAPVMDHPTVATHGEVDEFVKEIGQRKVRYGQVEGQQRLAVAPPTEVVRPGS